MLVKVFVPKLSLGVNNQLLPLMQVEESGSSDNVLIPRIGYVEGYYRPLFDPPWSRTISSVCSESVILRN